MLRLHLGGLRGWAVGAALLAAAVTTVPYVYGARQADGDHHFTGVIAWHADVLPYLAQIRQFRTALAIHNPVTPETDPYVVFNGLFGPLGWVARGTGLSPEFLYLHVVRVAALVATAAAVLALAAEAGLSRGARLVALLLAMFAAGWRWLVWIAPPGFPLHGLPYFRKIHAGSTLQQAMTVPHLTLAAALVCAVLYWFLRGCRTGSRRAFVAAGLALSYLTSFHPFEFIPLWATLGLLGLVLVLSGAQPTRQGTQPPVPGETGAPPDSPAADEIAASRRRVVEGLLWLFMLPLPPLLGFAIVSWRSPLFQNVSQQMVAPPTESLFFFIYYGPWLAVAGLAPFAAARGGMAARAARATLLGWLILVLVLDAIPLVPTQTHFQVGFHLICATLAAWVLVDGWPALRRHWWPWTLAAAAVALLAMPPLALYLDDIRAQLRQRATPYYLTNDERAALRWLEAATSSTTVVLADDDDFSMFVAPYTGARPVRAQNQQTAYLHEKNQLIRRFFGEDARPEERRAIVTQLGVRFVVVAEAAPEVRAAIEALWPSRFAQGNIRIHDVDA